MPTLLLERAPALGEGLEHEPRRWLGGAVVTGQTDAHGRFTLDELITSVWEGLAVRAAVSCPVCAGPMVPRRHSGAAQDLEDTSMDAGARSAVCLGCGTRLS
jgi:hypothetical protein